MELFSIESAGFKEWTFPALGLVFVMIGTFMFLYQLEDKEQIGKIVLAGFCTAFAIFWTITAGISSYKGYRRLLEAYQSGNCEKIKGTISDLHKEPRDRYIFRISDHTFELNHRISRPGMDAYHPAIKDGASAFIMYCEGDIAYMRVD